MGLESVWTVISTARSHVLMFTARLLLQSFPAGWGSEWSVSVPEIFMADIGVAEARFSLLCLQAG